LLLEVIAVRLIVPVITKNNNNIPEIINIIHELLLNQEFKRTPNALIKKAKTIIERKLIENVTPIIFILSEGIFI